MKLTKKALIFVICMALIAVSSFTGIVFAEEKVIFADDFSSYGVGETPTIKKDSAEFWSETATSATAKVTVEKDDNNNVISVSNSADKTGGPRIGKKLYLKGVDDLTVTFRTKSINNASASFSLAEGKNAFLTVKEQNASWADYKYVFDIKKGTYTSYKNGKKSSSGNIEGNFASPDGVFIRFSASVSNGKAAYFDDIKITTNSNVDIALLSDPTNVSGESSSAAQSTTTTTQTSSVSNVESYKKAMAQKRYIPASENVLFADDFSGYESGVSPEVLINTPGRWSEKAQSATATITVEDIDEQKVLCISNTAESGGPRIAKKIYPANLNTVSVSFMTRTEGSATVGFAAYNGTANAFSLSGGQNGWAFYEFIINIKDGTYVSYKDGEAFKSGKLAADLDCEITFRFGGTVKSGGKTLYDNIRITTPDKFDETAINSAVSGNMLTIDQYAELTGQTYKGPSPETTPIPSGAKQLFLYENNNNGTRIRTGTDAAWSSVVTSDSLKAVNVAGNEMIVAVNPRVSRTRSTLTKSLSLGSEAKDLTVEYMVYFIGDSSVKFALNASNNNVVGETDLVSASSVGANEGWNKIRYEFDFSKEKYTMYLNGKEREKDIPFTATAKNYQTVVAAIAMTTDNTESIVCIDNVYMYTNTEVHFDTMTFGSEGVNWDMVKGDPMNEKSFIKNLRPHPRVLLNSWDDIKYKIANDSYCAKWFENVKREADTLLTSPNVSYDFDGGRNWLTGARNVRTRLLVLSFTYSVTGDKRYLDRAMDEMRFAGSHPDWSNSAPIISSECMMGFAIAYDWMYYGLTDSEKTEIRQMICDKALWQFIHSYAGKSNVEIGKGTSNRTTVANSCGLMCAVAIADEMPDVANYVYQNALKHAKLSFSAYNDDGGFPEGSMYWEYSTRFAVLLMNTLQAAPVEGYEHDENAKWYLDNVKMKNTPKYNIYLNSAKKKFNFGDATDGLVYSPTLLWFASYCNEPFYKWYELDMLEKHSNNFQALDAVQAIIWNDINMKGESAAHDMDALFNTEQAAVCTMRESFSNEYTLFSAMQGGSNTTGHMSQSLGNFVVDALGQRFIQSVGAANYSSQYDSSMYYVRRTEGQNTLLVNPDESQGQEKTAIATFTKFEHDKDEAYSVLDMTKTHKAFSEAKRGMYMTKGRNTVVIQDEFKMNAPSELYWFAQTTAAITLAPDGQSALLSLGGQKMLAVLKKAPDGAKLSIMEAKPLPTSPLAPDELLKNYFKLAVHATGVTEGTISVEFIPIPAGESADVEKATPFKPISEWALSPDENKTTAKDAFGNSVALKIGSPIAFAFGHRTYVDSANYDVMPQIIDSRTLVPVRFISEKIGAEVRWDADQRKVTVVLSGDTIELFIDKNEMYINGNVSYLDVPAMILNDRTMIPLRALTEALGKKVFWDDRGLILINGEEQHPSEEQIVKMIELLDTLVYAGDTELASFDIEKSDYTLVSKPNNAVRVVSGGAEIAAEQGENEASFAIGGKNYHIRFVPDRFEGVIGTNDQGLISVMSLGSVPIQTKTSKQMDYIKVSSVEMSTGHDKYIPSGTIDNVINDEIINRWSGYGIGEYLLYDFGISRNIYAFGLATLNGESRRSKFKIEISDDRENWTEVINTVTEAKTKLFEIFPLGNVSARYVKLTGFGTTEGNLYNSWTEVRFWESESQLEEDKKVWQNGLNGTSAYNIGDSIQLVVQATNSKGEKMIPENVKYSASKDGIVTISDDGIVNVIGTGTVKIKASYFNGFKNLVSDIELVCEN